MGGAVVDEGPTGVRAPDGGWGWAVLLGCFIITGFSYAFPKAVSVFFKELMLEFGIGYSDTAWISSILLAMLYGTGLGLSLNFQPSLIMLNRYFNKRRPIANGLAAVDIFSRPAAGFIAGLPKVRPYSVYLFSFAMFFNGFTDLTGSTASDYGGLVVFCVFFGISYGMVGALQFEVLMAIVGTHTFSSAIGLVLLLEAIAVLIGPPSGGRLLDATHVYQYVFILAGAEVLAASLVLLLGNFFCIRRPAGATKEGESPKPPADDRDNRGGVDSREVEHFLKAEPEKKGEVAHTPETSV
ncbi:PREDICTED: monocarboxylate transporter 4 [Myotis davidii]|uniref:monocarboxylate transporter 4 n=1 Tax=Myotis davidii TaxID=225400 RepID=UPI0007674982|nr:PREDICTED: monocarboxylate transporter 4 [Myotis davidii]